MLVIILSVTLAVFLVLAIAATILAIIFFKKINRAAASAQRAAQNVEAFSESMKNASGPINLIRTIFNVINNRPRH